MTNDDKKNEPLGGYEPVERCPFCHSVILGSAVVPGDDIPLQEWCWCGYERTVGKFPNIGRNL